VERIAPDSITLSHGPVASVKWPAMTMGFSKTVPKAFPEIKEGDAVRFKFKEGGPSGYELVEVEKQASGVTR
ncbi:MAG: copper-binding protein, partial [Chloroflexota bacterium]|nr:copper-binding protein [Chloroflexota bacterium]